MKEPATLTTPANRVTTRVDDATIAARTAGYPESVREPVMWLLGYFRDNCSRSYPVLAERAAKLGHTRTPNFFNVVLTGSYFAKKDGKTQGSAANLIEIIDALRRDALIAERAGKVPFVETPTWLDIRDYIDAKRAPERVCKFGVIIGPTGSQKTACLKHYRTLNNHGTCIHVEAPSTGNMGDFLSDVAARYGEGAWANASILKRKIAENMNDRKCIIVDNVQRLFKADKGNDQPVFNYLQKLQDDKECTIIFSIAALGARFLTEGIAAGFFEQFEGRAGGRKSFLVLPDYAPAEDVLAIARAFGMSEALAYRGDAAGNSTLPRWLKYLIDVGREHGRIRILFEALQTARELADQRGEALSLDIVKAARGEEVEV